MTDTTPIVPEDPQEKFNKLRLPFPAEAISTLPKGGTNLSYVGHAAVTDRLLSVDPYYNWAPAAVDERGNPIPIVDKSGAPVGLWIKLTVLGVTRWGYGSCQPGKQEAMKELIGDALRNAAMRFGVALELWSKNDLESVVAPQEPELNISGLLTGLASLGVNKTRVEKKLGHSADDMKPWEFEMLKNYGTKIKTGQMTVDAAFPAASLDMKDVGVGAPPSEPKSEVHNSPQPKGKKAAA